MIHLKAFKPLENELLLTLTGSKSETNRLLILQALWPEISLNNLAQCDDASVMIQALTKTQGTIDVGHAGTAMRFLTAYFASRPDSSVVLTGSPRMLERPIGILVDALRSLGAEINYLRQEGFPPLAIKGVALVGGEITMSGSVSSQYLTALMLVATRFKNGLTIHIKDGLTSLPYVTMTRSLLQSLGVDVVVSDEKIQVTGALQKHGRLLSVESDWSGASYWYSMVALTPDMSLKLRYLNQDSRQGDSAIADLFQRLGVMTEFDVEQQSVLLRATNQPLPDYVSWDLSDTPDIAQTIAVCCFALGVRCHLSGLHTLKIKETDRLEALTVELSKLGAMVVCNEYSISIEARKEPIKPNISIKTYNDHRMAMAFAPLVSRVPIYIEDHGVVSKSYPNFWKDMANVGLEYSLGN